MIGYCLVKIHLSVKRMFLFKNIWGNLVKFKKDIQARIYICSPIKRSKNHFSLTGVKRIYIFHYFLLCQCIMSEKYLLNYILLLKSVMTGRRKKQSETQRKLFESAVTKPRNIHKIWLILVCFKQQLVVIQNNVKIKYNINEATKKKW